MCCQAEQDFAARLDHANGVPPEDSDGSAAVPPTEGGGLDYRHVGFKYDVHEVPRAVLLARAPVTSRASGFGSRAAMTTTAGRTWHRVRPLLIVQMEAVSRDDRAGDARAPLGEEDTARVAEGAGRCCWLSLVRTSRPAHRVRNPVLQQGSCLQFRARPKARRVARTARCTRSRPRVCRLSSTLDARLVQGALARRISRKKQRFGYT
jgi:hypothetical protein